MSESRGVREFGFERFCTMQTVSAYEMLQAPSGKAGYYDSSVAASVNDYLVVRTSGTAIVKKQTGIAALKGGRVYWDHSANVATYKRSNDRDFYIGRWACDAASNVDMAEILINEDPPYDIDLMRDPFASDIVGQQLTASATYQFGHRAKGGIVVGWVVGAATNLPYVATLAASQTGCTLVVPVDGLQIGDVITGFKVNAQVESAGNTVTIDADLRAVTNVAAEPTDASIGTMAQVSVTADTAVSQAKTGLSEVVASGKTYYLLITATTGAATDIILQACEITVTRPLVGSGALVQRGGSLLELSATNEAQKVDALSVDGFSKNAHAIVEFVFRVLSDGAGSTPDVSIGAASGTHASDADSITDYMLVHLDGNATDIKLQSKGGASPVGATDTQVDYTEGADIASRVEVWFDFRDPEDVQAYINGVNVLPASVFDVGTDTDVLYLLVHLEKTASTDTYQLAIDSMRARYAEQ